MNHTPDLGEGVHAEYEDLSPLKVRIATHRKYSEVPDDPDAAIRDALGLPSNADLLDIGCGTGQFLHDLTPAHRGRLVAIDTSPEALHATRTDRITALQASADNLPLADNEFDIVTARHMLYHVPDPLAALTEARRVLRPGGTFVATVNHPGGLPNTHALVRQAVADVGLTPSPSPTNEMNSDTLPPLVSRVFTHLHVTHYDNALRFDQPEPLTAFAIALLAFCGAGPDTAPAQHQQLTAAITTRVTHWFSNHPGQPWTDPKGYSLVRAT